MASGRHMVVCATPGARLLVQHLAHSHGVSRVTLAAAVTDTTAATANATVATADNIISHRVSYPRMAHTLVAAADAAAADVICHGL